MASIIVTALLASTPYPAIPGVRVRMFPASLARAFAPHLSMRGDASPPLGSWVTVDGGSAVREIERATGVFPLNLDENDVYDIFYLQNGFPVAVVVLNSGASHIKYAAKSPIAVMFGADDILDTSYFRFRSVS